MLLRQLTRKWPRNDSWVRRDENAPIFLRTPELIPIASPFSCWPKLPARKVDADRCMLGLCGFACFFFAADKTPIEVAQEAFKLGKKLKRSAAVVRELLERVSLRPLWLARGRRVRRRWWESRCMNS